jgi:hydrogenase/urease accessory protein HupE
LRVLAALLLACLAFAAQADVFRPAYLELREAGEDRYDVMWKVPAQGDARLAVEVIFPSGTTKVAPPRGLMSAGAYVEQWQISRAGGLAGQTIAIDGLVGGITDVIVRIERLDGTSQVEHLLPQRPQFTVKGTTGTAQIAWSYLVLGIEHILTGFDHLLFVLALVILVKGVRRLIATVTAFTVAHSLTLVAATLGWVHVPSPAVEAAIALSIVFVAGEIIRARQGNAGLTQRYPWVVAFTFGLLHGLGFAGALAEVGLPQLSIPIALLFFNVGVEIGQLMFIAAVLAVIAMGRWMGHRIAVSQPRWLWRIPPYAIGGSASYWVIERVAAF